MTLYHKYRPSCLEEMYGNEGTISILKAILEEGEPPHAFLFHGPTGCGKTTLGRIVANNLGCRGDDFHEMDSAHFRGIDTIREIRKRSQYSPLQGRCTVWLLDECHKLTNDAQNALLKALEDPPESVYFILATTEPDKLISTIKGRCSLYEVKPLSDNDMADLLTSIVKAEGERLQGKIYEQIIQDSLGYPRNALQILGQVLAVDSPQRMEVAKKQAELQSQSIELFRALLRNAGWGEVSGILAGLKGQDPESIRRQALGYCQAVLLKSDHEIAARVLEEFIDPFYNAGFPGLTLACYSIVVGFK